MPADSSDLYRTTVQAEWIDYNGHMNLAYYLLVFDKATDAMFDLLELGREYVRTCNHSLFVLEAHLGYERELKLGDPLRIASQLIDLDDKRVHFFATMHHDAAGYRAATGEFVALHVDLSGPRAAPFPARQRALTEAMLDRHRALPQPPQLGRSIGLRRKPA